MQQLEPCRRRRPRLPRTSSPEKVQGYKMEEITTKDESTELSSSGIQWAASLFVVLVLALFVWGWRRRR
jgi:cobaltochelatase CobN